MELSAELQAQGATARPAEPLDAPAVAALVRECELADIGEVYGDEDDIVAGWQRPSFDLTTDSMLVSVGGDVVAYGEVYRGRRAEACVRPAARGRGIGTALMRWTWTVAQQHASPLVGQTVAEQHTDAVALFTANSYQPLWTSWVLELPPDAPPEPPPQPTAWVIRPMAAGEERTAFRVIEDAFSEWPNREASTFEDWAATTVNRIRHQPWHVLVAVDAGDRIVGACVITVAEGVGWVDQIAVERSARGRGIGRSLLQWAFAVTRDHGATACELSTDSRTGALSLYEHVGMRVKETFVHWAREVGSPTT